MNVEDGAPPGLSAAIWESAKMRNALANRDLKQVYEFLGSSGVSQREIGSRTGQSQSEIYEVLHKNRQIQAYDVLARIADGLGIPRGYMGLAYDQTTELALDLAAATCSTDADERDEVRELLSHAANVTMGTSADDIAAWWQPIDSETAPAPERIDVADVIRIRALTDSMRTLDYRHGGGSCRDAVAAQVRWAQQLLNAERNEVTDRMLLTALADLHNLAGWTSFDVGMYRVARKHFGRAHAMAQRAGDHSLAANILYRTGRLHLHRGTDCDTENKRVAMFKVALKFFQLGQITAQDSGSSLTVAMLCANEGWAYGLLGDRAQMSRSLGRAQDEFARSTPGDSQAWVRFFSEADLDALTGIALTALPSPSSADLASGIEHITRAIDQRGPDMTRSRTFELTALATAYVREGSTDLGLHIGQQSLKAAAAVRSVRTVDRLRPLRDAARARRTASLHPLVQAIDSMRKSA
ncbi:transcriptional regulator [Nocardia uniformis]|nr:transcriptional regulator [Nocardia uniformis]